eukprot:6193124-Pleurochrysis_carterae.AAC.1
MPEHGAGQGSSKCLANEVIVNRNLGRGARAPSFLALLLLSERVRPFFSGMMPPRPATYSACDA